MITKIFAVFAGTALAAMLLVLFTQVVLRYCFRIGIIWTDELSRYLMLWIIMLGAGVVTFQDSHIRITLVEDLCPAALQYVLKLVRYLVMAAFSITLTYYSMSMLQSGANSVSSNMRIPMNYVYFCFPVSAASMALFSVFQFVKTALGAKPRKEKEDWQE